MERYEIRIAGQLSPRRVGSLGCVEVDRLTSGESVLAYDAVDAAALYGLLSRLRDVGVELIGIERTAGGALAQADSRHEEVGDDDR